MLRRTMLTVLTALALLIPPATPAGCQPVTASRRKDDPRLERPVTVLRARVRVGELLDRLSTYSGVALSAGDRGDGASDPEVAVFAEKVRLGDLMNAIWSLVSYQGAEWHWSRTGRAPGFRYQLERPAAAQLLGARLREQLQADFEAQAARMVDAIDLPPEQLRLLEGRDPGLDSLIGNDRLGFGDRNRGGLRLFRDVLTSEQQIRVLRGHEAARVPFGELPQSGQAWVRDLWAQTGVQESLDGGPFQPVPVPSWVEFRADRLDGEMTPALFILPEKLGGYAYVGGKPFEDWYQRKLQELWMLPGDTRADDAGGRRVPTPVSQPAPRSGEGILAYRLEQLARASDLPVMARLPYNERNVKDPRPPYGSTVQGYLQPLWSTLPHLGSKWRHGVLLVAFHPWFLPGEDDTLVPWGLVKHLRQAERDAGGLLTLDDLAAAAAALTEGQLNRLGREFAAMTFVARWRDLFGLYQASPAAREHLASPAGMPIAEVLPLLGPESPPKARSLAQRQLKSSLASGRVTAVRLRVIRTDERLSPSAEIGVDLLAQDGSVVARVGTRYWRSNSE
jgi:hypothetical protein